MGVDVAKQPMARRGVGRHRRPLYCPKGTRSPHQGLTDEQLEGAARAEGARRSFLPVRDLSRKAPAKGGPAAARTTAAHCLVLTTLCQCAVWNKAHLETLSEIFAVDYRLLTD